MDTMNPIDVTILGSVECKQTVPFVEVTTVGISRALHVGSSLEGTALDVVSAVLPAVVVMGRNGNNGALSWTPVVDGSVPPVQVPAPTATVSADESRGAALEVEQAVFLSVVVGWPDVGDDPGLSLHAWL